MKTLIKSALFAATSLVLVSNVANAQDAETKSSIDVGATIAAYCKATDTTDLKESVINMCNGSYTPKLIKDGSRFSNRSNAGKAMNAYLAKSDK